MSCDSPEPSLQRLPQQPMNRPQQPRQLQRLLHDRASASLSRQFHGTVTGGYDDDRQKRVYGGHPFESLPTTLARHFEIQEHDIDIPFIEFLEHFVAVSRENYVEVFGFQRVAQG